MTRTALIAHPSAELYGSDRMVVASVRALQRSGWRVVVALPVHGPLVSLLRAQGAEVALVPAPVLRRSALAPRALVRLLVEAVRRLPAMLGLLRRTDPDVVYVNTVTVPTWVLAGRLARRRVVCHVHEAEEGGPMLLRALLLLPLLLAHAVLVNSRAAQVALGALPGLARRSHLLYNGVAGPPPTPDREAVPDPVRLVLVGRLSPRKGTDVAVAAVAELLASGVDARLELVGEVFPGYEWYADQLRTQVATAGLTDRVVFTGFRSDVWPSLAAADVVLVPSRTEPFGNVAVEGGLAQRPVVASSVQGLTEIVEHDSTGLLVPPDDPTALADAVRALLVDWPRARHLARRAQEQAHRRFSPAAYDERLLALLQGAAAVTGPTGSP